MDPNARFRLASHIHFALLRHYGEAVDVGTLLRGGETAREALWVCEASEHPGLAEQARALKRLLAEEAAARTAALRATPVPQEAAWARDTSGFGLSHPVGDARAPETTRAPGWLASAVGWRKRRVAPRSPR